ncbi:MAG TPA: hypothetical protein VF245_11820 [Solirubrobacterales bacterium]
MTDTPPDPYKSARDLPSVVEMTEQLRGFKSLTLLVGREQRSALRKIESQLSDLVQTIDGFYERLGKRHWIFHESLKTEVVKKLVPMEPEDAEQTLIAYYQEADTIRFMLHRLRRFPAMRTRLPMIERAQEDYEAERFDSVVLKLLAVMDGFVNDFETEQRRGLHARSDDEMAAWDSVVGHHMGLSRAHRTFTQSFRKTSEDEVYELYRNGIVHGMLPNFNNVIVATKAWNRLLAVADWAQSREKQAEPKEREPTMGEVLEQMAETERLKKATDAWQASTLTPSDDGFESEAIFGRAAEFLDGWKSKNYGKMAGLLAKLTREGSRGKDAGQMRDLFSMYELEDFEIVRLDFQAPVICVVDAELRVDGDTKVGRMRWISEQEKGEPAVPGTQEGDWLVMTWGPYAMFNEAASADAA